MHKCPNCGAPMNNGSCGYCNYRIQEQQENSTGDIHINNISNINIELNKRNQCKNTLSEKLDSRVSIKDFKVNFNLYSEPTVILSITFLSNISSNILLISSFCIVKNDNSGIKLTILCFEISHA